MRTLVRSRELGPAHDGEGITIGFVVAEFHRELAADMLARAQDRAKQARCKLGPVLRIAGTFDAPLPCEWLLEQDAVDAVVCIGAVVKGETMHDEVITHSTAQTLQALALEYDKPIGLAITGPGMTMEQAQERVDAGAHAVDAVLRVIEAWRELND
ncbi:MAG: 6,7-dimethyl-8-ribityllumazine synthase [Halobacteriales archaeon]|nr:6,7-dimethyl-8-ribityllumazine synthase [Halobacteriales archaeon]